VKSYVSGLPSGAERPSDVTPQASPSQSMTLHPGGVFDEDRKAKIREALKLQSEYEIDKYLTPVNADHARRLIQSKEVYPISKPVRGRAVIINIEWYQDKDMMRPGSTIDMENLRSLFTALHFGTDVWENCDLEALKQKLDEERKLESHKDAEAFILAVLSHGEEGHVICCDEKRLSIDDIRAYFDGSRCEHLKGKPKLFLIQACQTGGHDTSSGAERRTSSSDGATAAGDTMSIQHEVSPRKSSEELPTDKADMLTAWSTISGHFSNRYTTLGGLFIREFVFNMMLHAHTHDLTEILCKVREYLSQPDPFGQVVQMSRDESTLRRKLYFFPGYKREDTN